MRLDPEFDKFYDVVINESNEIISNDEDIIIRKKVFILHSILLKNKIDCLSSMDLNQ